MTKRILYARRIVKRRLPLLLKVFSQPPALIRRKGTIVDEKTISFRGITKSYWGVIFDGRKTVDYIPKTDDNILLVWEE